MALLSLPMTPHITISVLSKPLLSDYICANFTINLIDAIDLTVLDGNWPHTVLKMKCKHKFTHWNDIVIARPKHIESVKWKYQKQTRFMPKTYIREFIARWGNLLFLFRFCSFLFIAIEWANLSSQIISINNKRTHTTLIHSLTHEVYTSIVCVCNQ